MKLRLLIIVLAIACMGQRCPEIPVPPPDPTPTPTPTPEPTPTPTPEPTPTPSPDPTPEPTPEPTPPPCVDEGGWWADGLTDGVNGCGPTGQHKCFDTMQAACNERLDYQVRQGHLSKHTVEGQAWYQHTASKWFDASCQRYDGPNGQKMGTEKDFGIERTPGWENPCPTPTPTPTPTPEPTPTPPPGECLDGPPDCMTIDVSCAGATDCGIPDPPGWRKGGPVPIQLKRQAWPPGWVVKLDVSYCRGGPGNKVHAEDACYPGPISEWTNVTLVHNCADPECHNDGSTPFPGKHVLRLEGGHTGKWRYTAHGALGLTASATLEVR